MKKPILLVAIFLIGAGVFGIVRHQRERIEQRRNEAISEIEMLRLEMKKAYVKRGAMLRAWTKGTPLETEAEFHSLLVENDGLELQTQPEFDRFDWVQEQLNRAVTSLLTNKKFVKKKPAEWESVERAVATARSTYTKRAISANAGENLPVRAPVFKAEEALASEPK